MSLTSFVATRLPSGRGRVRKEADDDERLDFRMNVYSLVESIFSESGFSCADLNPNNLF